MSNLTSRLHRTSPGILIGHVLLAVLCLGFLAPLGFLIREAFFSGKAPLTQEAGGLVWALSWTTLRLLAVAVPTAVFIGTGAAVLVSRFSFPGRKVFSILLCLPFALPPYLLAGVARQAQHAGWIPLPPLENVTGCGILLALSLYPWVYVPMKAQLSLQSRHYRDVAETLGMGVLERLRFVHAGLLLPTVIVTAVLVAMEVISDTGTVTLLGVKTLSVGIMDAMFSMGRSDWAAQLSLVGMCVPVLAVTLFALWHRRRMEYQPPNRPAAAPLHDVSLPGAVGIPVLLSLPVLAGFGLPVFRLAAWTYENFGRIPLRDLPGQLGDTLILVMWVVGLTLVPALLLNLLLRRHPSLRLWKGLVWLFNLNYALPGVILAIAVLFLSQGAPDSWLSDTVVLLVLACVCTFFCFPFFTIQSGLCSISPRLDELGLLLDFRAHERVTHLYLPLLKRAVAGGLLLVLVTLVKELPLTQTLQPFGFHPLSLRVYTFAGLDLLEESALVALCLIALVLYPVVALDRLISEPEGDVC